MVTVDGGLHPFEGRPEPLLQFIEEGCLEGIAEERVIEISDIPPQAAVSQAAFGDQAVDMGVPLQVAAEGVEDADESGGEGLGFVHPEEHAQDDAPYGREKTVQEGAVGKEERPQLFRNGEDAMAVPDIDDLEGHGEGTVDGILVPACGAETAVAAEGDELQLPADRTAIHGTAERGIAAVDHLVDVLDDRWAGMHRIDDFLVMIPEDSLEYVHATIMNQTNTKRNPYPS